MQDFFHQQYVWLVILHPLGGERRISEATVWGSTFAWLKIQRLTKITPKWRVCCQLHIPSGSLFDDPIGSKKRKKVVSFLFSGATLRRRNSSTLARPSSPHKTSSLNTWLSLPFWTPAFLTFVCSSNIKYFTSWCITTIYTITTTTNIWWLCVLFVYQDGHDCCKFRLQWLEFGHKELRNVDGPPWKSIWNLEIIHLERTIIFHISIFGFHVNFSKVYLENTKWEAKNERFSANQMRFCKGSIFWSCNSRNEGKRQLLQTNIWDIMGYRMNFQDGFNWLNNPKA